LIAIDPTPTRRSAGSQGGVRLPAITRRRLLEALAEVEIGQPTQTLVDATRVSKTTTRRHLEDLEAHGVVRSDEDDFHGHIWQLTKWAREKLRELDRVPETSTHIPPSGADVVAIPEMSGHPLAATFPDPRPHLPHRFEISGPSHRVFPKAGTCIVTAPEMSAAYFKRSRKVVSPL
jgi:DNA-binding transcriptional ArsR family regulator